MLRGEWKPGPEMVIREQMNCLCVWVALAESGPSSSTVRTYAYHGKR
jgi:hypothetical protein